MTVNAHADEQLTACLKYALGLEGGGGRGRAGRGSGAASGDGEGGVFFWVELCETLAPKWARAKM